MKSYNVKSNAKRFARGLAEKHAGIGPAEPQEICPGAREWYPAVSVLFDDVDVDALRSAIGDAAVILNAEPEGVAPVDVTDLVGEFPNTGAAAVEDAEAVSPMRFPIDPPVMLEPGTEYRIDVADGKATVTKAANAGKTSGSALAELLAGSPAKSTPEDIAARRAARRQRIEAGEYALDTRGAATKAKKETRADIIMRMAGQDDGATAEAIATACGWQAHTLRGYIGGTLRKRLAPEGKTITAVRKSGEPTRYVVTALEENTGAA